MSNKEISSKEVRHLYTQNYFLENASGHSEFKDFNGKYEHLIEKFQFVINCLNLHNSYSLLDIGCGRGEVVIYHSLDGGNATGVDFSEDAINLARLKAADLKASCSFLNDSFENIPDEPKFDRIISVDFIEHISGRESKLFFTRCYSLLKPGGRLVVFTYPNTLRRKYGYSMIRIFSCFRKTPLPAKEPDTISEHYKQYHLNEQNYFVLKAAAKNEKFRKITVKYFDTSIKESFLKTILVNTPFRHLFLKGLTLIADK
ncbi:MAG: Methyltransferase protein [Bacteroidota bacterium]|nr:Methyltransferase protein [Bacteroidota bacterium]